MPVDVRDTGVLLPSLAARFGDRPDAVTVGDQSCSWSELADRGAAVALDVRGSPAVAVRATATIDTVVAVVGGLLAGVPVVPVPPDAGPVEREHILRDSKSALIIGDPPWDECGLARIPIPTVGRRGASAARPPAIVADAAAALIMYTSGTTGLPKGAVLSRRAIAADLDGLAEAWSWSADDHLVHGLPLFHVHGLIVGVLGALRHGSRLTHTGRPTPGNYAAAAGTLYFGVPTVWSRVCGEPAAAEALRGARLLVSGSAPLPTSVFARLAELTGHLPIERYGMTETLITLSTRADGERRPGFVGTPIRGVETRIVAEDGRTLVPDDGETIGGLQVRGETMFDGYVSGDGAHGHAHGGWFVTGDAATVGPDGFHRIVGRASIDIIKSGGFKIGAGEVESILLDHPAVAEVAVVGVVDDDLGQRVVAYVVLDGGGSSAIVGQLDEFVRSRLTSHKCPREIRIVDALPRNAMGKVLKSQLSGS